MKIHWTVAALADIDAILASAADRNQAEAHNIKLRVEKTVLNILTFPQAARYVKAKDYYERVIPRTRVILVYRILDAGVVVIAAFHSSRDVSSKP